MQIASIAESETFYQLRHRAVRDLAWCCLSAPLLQALPQGGAQILPLDTGDIWPWLHELDKDPTALLTALASIKSTRLGIYYETLWRFYFSHNQDWLLLAHNLPINRGKATLGAFDFLCQQGDDFWHIETAVKFYLCATRDPQQAIDWRYWIGPNSNDRLDLKLARLCDHQLPLHTTLEGRSALQTHFPHATHWKTGLCMQGYLFSPAPTNLNPAALSRAEVMPHFIRPHHSHASQGMGFWWHLRDFLHINTTTKDITADTVWIALQRAQWFAPVQLSYAELTMEAHLFNDKVCQQVQQTKRPLMIAAVKKHRSDDSADIVWREVLRSIVVPDDWPAIPE